MRSRRAGFTLIEICLAVVIALLVLTIAIPSVTAVFRDQRLQRVVEQFDDLVRKAQLRSVDERRTYALIWQKDAVVLTPMERVDEQPGEMESMGLSKGQELIIDRTAAMGKAAPPVWTFWRSGVCEPATITYHGPEGSWVATYDPLTARRTSLATNAP